MSETKSGFEGERIAKAIARAGVCSRRDAEAMILEGRVSVNGKKLSSPALNVTDSDDIRIDGKPMPTAERTRLFRYYKPRGLVTTAKDPQGRPTVFDSLPPGMPRVISVGRLDLNSEGLLLLTNDGELARRLELPTTGWVRRYRVRVHGEVDQAQVDQLGKGITVEGVRYGAIDATLDRRQGDNVWLTMALTEGKNREIRKICGHFGWPVSRLIRVAYGPFQLGHLERGDIEEVPAKVLREQLGEKKPVHKIAGQLKLKRTPAAAPKERATSGWPGADSPSAERGSKQRPAKRHPPR
ncbi:MAG TPA: pseudouridine synthase [Dongiaceae bacterium]|jgi:23S rRNA pseudouridine2605 synthase|nr:pseudouridine synthase [Dongiaceae bacterium]